MERSRAAPMLSRVWTHAATLHRAATHPMLFVCCVHSLNDNGIGIDGAKALAAVLPQCASLQALECVVVPCRPPYSVPAMIRC